MRTSALLRRATKAPAMRAVRRHASSGPKIVWTYTDEAPALATFALLLTMFGAGTGQPGTRQKTWDDAA